MQIKYVIRNRMKIFFWIILCICSVQGVIAQNTLRIMSYNIHHGVGMDEKADYDRLAKTIKRMDPDIVALQEVDSVTLRSRGADILQELSENVLMHRIFVPAIPYQGGKYGIGLLSKEKPLAYRCLTLPGREEQRVLLVAEFDRYVVCCTHLSLTPADQLASVDLIIQAVGQYAKPVFLAGDLNTLPDSEVSKKLKEKFALLTDAKQKTYPAPEPRECLDYIWGYTGNGSTYAVAGRQVVNDPVASDHRPVFAAVRLKTAKEDIFRTTPYLQNPADGGMTICWLTNTPVYSWVEYGTDTLHLQKAHTLLNGQVVSNNRVHKIRLEQLVPGEKYYYRVCSREILVYQSYHKDFGETAKTGFYSFELPAENTTDFTALIFNDIHNHYKTMAALYEQVKELKYDFVVFNGDCFDGPANENEVVYPLQYYNTKVGADRVPVIYLRGNHEIRNAYSLKLPEFIDYIGGKTYGAFSWGDTRFVLLDCGEDKPDDHWVYYGLNDFTQFRNEQVEFLKEELNSKVFRKANKRVLMHHVPLYGNTDDYQPCKELWSKLLSKAPFQVSLNAHTHEYAFHPKGSLGNNFPVFIGGGYSMDSATVMVLRKEGQQMSIKVLNVKGEVLKEMQL